MLFEQRGPVKPAGGTAAPGTPDVERSLLILLDRHEASMEVNKIHGDTHTLRGFPKWRVSKATWHDPNRNRPERPQGWLQQLDTRTQVARSLADFI